MVFSNEDTNLGTFTAVNTILIQETPNIYTAYETTPLWYANEELAHIEERLKGVI